MDLVSPMLYHDHMIEVRRRFRTIAQDPRCEEAADAE